MTRRISILYTQAFSVFALLALLGSSFVINYNIYFQVAAQTVSSPDLAKVLVDSAVQALQSGNVNKTIMHLKAAEQELVLLAIAQENGNTNIDCFSILPSSTILVLNDAIQSLKNSNDTSKALLFIDLAEKQLGESLLYVTNANNCATIHTIPAGTFLIYTNPAYGLRIQYQYDWIVEGTSNPTGAGGVVITSFYLPDARNGLPFFRIGVDNLTKEFSHKHTVNINNYLNRSLEDKNSTGFPNIRILEHNTNNTLAGNPAYRIIWTYTNPVYGERKSIEIGTIIGNKGYFRLYYS